MKEKKKVKLSVIILIVLLSILLIVGIYYLRNYCIINDIFNKQATFKNYTNYSFRTKSYVNHSQPITVDYAFKDGNYTFKVANNDNSSLTWYNSKSNEMITISLTEKTATTAIREDFIMMPLPTMGSDKITLTFSSFISSEMVNGKDCYKIVNNANVQYFNKENGTLVKSVSNSDIDGKETISTVEFSNFEFNKLTDKDVAKPDLTGYNIL